jgi:CrcB protein
MCFQLKIMAKYLYIMAGGAIGCALRFVVSGLFKSPGGNFPAGTLTVNLAGSLLIGLLFGWLSVNGEIDEKMRLLLFTGFLGGFTTFSAFALENFQMLHEGHITASVFYILLSNVAGIALAFTGYYTAIRIK